MTSAASTTVPSIQSAMDTASSASNDRDMLDSIEELLRLETDILDYLSMHSTDLAPEDEAAAVDKVNKLTTMRNSLYDKLTQSLTSATNTSQAEIAALNNKYGTLWAQEKQLTSDKQRLLASESDRENKRRLVEINQYYYDQMSERRQFMQELVAFLALVGLCVGLALWIRVLPIAWVYVLLLIICTLFAPRLWNRYRSIESRDNMDYQKYVWYFKLPDTTSGAGGSNAQTAADLSALLQYGKSTSCVGDACCAAGTTFDATAQKCTPTPTTTATTTATAS